MGAGSRRALFAACLAAQALTNFGLAAAARTGCAPSTVTLGLAASFAPYAGALVLARSFANERALRRIALAAPFVLGGAFVLAPPVLSDDLYRYLWEGRLWLEGFNPYRFAPDDPALAQLRDDVWAHINNKPLATIYPPLSQLLFIVAAWLGGKASTVKLLALLAHGVSVAVVARSCAKPDAALALGLNPLLLSEGALNGHFDVLTGAALLVAAWALTRQRFVRGAFATCVAVGLKLVGVVILPLFARRPKAFLATALGSALFASPLVFARGPLDPASGAGQFAARWQGNDSLFAIVDWLSGQLFSNELAGIASRAVVAGLVLMLSVQIVRRRVSPLPAARALLWSVLLLSPQVHPWYLAWLLPLEVAAGGSAGLVWSATVLCAYAPLDGWLAEGRWEMPLGAQIFEYAAVFLALALDPRRPSLRGDGADSAFVSDSRLLD